MLRFEWMTLCTLDFSLADKDEASPLRFETLTMIRRIREFLRSEDGPTAVEYAVLLAGISIACIGAVNSMSQATADSFDQSAAELNGVLGS